MTYKQIEAAREVRLWTKEIVVPTLAIVVGAMAVPEIRVATVNKFKSVKESIKKKFKKTEG